MSAMRFSLPHAFLRSEDAPASADPYLPLRLLGRGGKARVYEVLDGQRRRRLALKLFHLPEDCEAVERERRALARLDHPGIVRVLDSGRTTRGAPYLVMELVEGRTCQSHVKSLGPPGTRVRTQAAADLVRELLRILRYLHGRGVLHRDVKSSNVLIAADGVKLLDLGTARWGHAAGAGRFIGTVSYASPEQLQGRQLDGRSDLYSLGVLWYRMLTGRLPFPELQPEEAARLRRDAALLPPHELADVPRWMSEQVMALLCWNPAQRPRVQQLLERLGPAARGRAPASWRWPAVAPFFGRNELLARIVEYGERPPPGGVLLLEGAVGCGRGAAADWAREWALRRGRSALRLSPGTSWAAALLLALPRHRRQLLRRRLSAATLGSARALLCGLAEEEPLLLFLGELESWGDELRVELGILRGVLAERGLPAAFVASASADERAAPGVQRLRFEPLTLADQEVWVRALLGGRQAPARLGRELAPAAGHPAALQAALRGLVEDGRLRAGRTPQGQICWRLRGERPVRSAGESGSGEESIADQVQGALRRGELALAGQLLGEAAAAGGSAGDRLQLLQGELALLRGELHAAHALLVASQPTRELGPELRARAAAAAGRTLIIQGRFREARAALRGALGQLRGEAARAEPLARLRLELACLELELGRFGWLREEADDAELLLEDGGSSSLAVGLTLLRGRLALRCGDADLALRRLDAADAEAARAGLELDRARARCLRCLALARQGRGSQALRELQSPLALLQASGALPDLALACRCHWEVRGPRADPETCFAPVVDWYRREPVPLLEIRYRIARLRHAARCRPQGAREELTALTRLIEELLCGGTRQDRRALLQGPWRRFARELGGD